ncbi:MAG: cytochrome C, partial [Acidobacteriota bacterium]
MSQLFHPAANSIAKISVVAGALAAGLVAILVLFVLPRSSYVTRQHEARVQPVPFYHAHHVGSMGI